MNDSARHHTLRYQLEDLRGCQGGDPEAGSASVPSWAAPGEYAGSVD